VNSSSSNYSSITYSPPWNFGSIPISHKIEMSQQSAPAVAWCFTLNNPIEEEITNLNTVLNGAEVKYAVYQKEEGDSGTPHLQGYLEMSSKKRLASVKRLLGTDRIHLEKRKGTRDQARTYCKKEDTRLAEPVEFGIWRHSDKTTGLSRLVDGLRNGKTLADVAREEPETFIQYHNGIRKWHALTLTSAKQAENVRGLWLYGQPGIGKSHKAREISGDNLYLKSQNKWWDGYTGETHVVLDDLDKGGACLGHYLKIWSDKWSCTGEIKGGVVNLEHDHFIVTSNYHPADLWPDDPPMLQAIMRRFVIKEGTQRGSVVTWKVENDENNPNKRIKKTE